MNIWTHYHLARSVAEALQVLAAAPGPARPIAGGTDLLLDLQQGRHPPVHTLVDVSEIAEMAALEVRQDALFVGAAVPLSRIVASPLVSAHAQALSEAAGLIGGPQVRNTATLGGNVGHALPAGDGTIALLACGASAEIAAPDGRRRVGMAELFAGPGQSTLDPHRELIVGFYLPLGEPGQASAFRRVMRPQGVAIAILNLAAWVWREGDRLRDVRLAVGPAGRTPLRATDAEAVLRRAPFGQQALEQALAALLDHAQFRTSRHRATRQYRLQMAGVLLRDVLETAWRRSMALNRTPASADDVQGLEIEG